MGAYTFVTPGPHSLANALDEDLALNAENQWIEKKERGSSWTIRFMILLCKRQYRWLVNLLLYPISLYFFLTSRTGYKASQHFFINAKGSFSWRDYFLQILCFSKSIVDRVSILLGEAGGFNVKAHGREALIQAREKGQGVILLGAHLGNFEACKLLVKDRADLDVHVVAYTAGSMKIRQQLQAINPEFANNIIDPTASDAVFLMRDVIERGGILAILGDRVGIGDKTLPVEFLGEPTLFPAGPYFLASILNCPVYCFFGLRAGNGIYHSYTMKLADSITLKRNQRLQSAQVYAQAFADFLAEKARQYPYNWFNFFEFWQPPQN